MSVMFVNAVATFRRRELCAEAAQARLKSGSSGRPPSFPFAQQQDSDCTDADEQLWTVVKPKKGWRSLPSTLQV